MLTLKACPRGVERTILTTLQPKFTFWCPDVHPRACLNLLNLSIVKCSKGTEPLSFN